MKQNKPLKTLFLILLPNVYPVFLDCSTVKLPQRDISRLQLSIISGFALTEYKIQGATFDNAVIDLKRHSREDNVIHKQFCSTYIQQSRLYNFAGLGLLQPIDITNINNQPYFRFYDEYFRLDSISFNTSNTWKEKITARRL